MGPQRLFPWLCVQNRFCRPGSALSRLGLGISQGELFFFRISPFLTRGLLNLRSILCSQGKRGAGAEPFPASPAAETRRGLAVREGLFPPPPPPPEPLRSGSSAWLAGKAWAKAEGAELAGRPVETASASWWASLFA